MCSKHNCIIICSCQKVVVLDQHPNFLAAIKPTTAFARNMGLLKHFTVIHCWTPKSEVTEPSRQFTKCFDVVKYCIYKYDVQVQPLLTKCSWAECFAVLCIAATIISRSCAQSKAVPFINGCYHYMTGDGHNRRCFCDDRDYCNSAPRPAATTLLSVLSAVFAATYRLLAN